MDLGRSNAQTAAGEPLMGMSLTYINDVPLHICINYENGVLVSAYIKSLPLPYGIELGSVMTAYYLSERIFLVSCLLYMLSSTAVCLSLETYVISDWLRKLEKVIIRKQ